MASPQSSFLFGESFTAADWKEAVDLHSPSQLSIGKQRAVTTLTAYVEDFTKLKACLHYLRGYAWVDTDLTLRRNLPARHPIWKNMVCTEILECHGLQFDSKQDVSQDNPDLPFATYKKFKLVASFSAPPYAMAADGDVLTEDERWVTFGEKPYVDYFQAQMGEAKFSAPSSSFHTTPIPYAVPVRSQKSVYELKWWEVPSEFVRDSEGITPKFDAAIGKVNSDTYAGKYPGTLMVDDIDVEVYNDPIVGDILGTLGRFVNVTFKFRIWDPTEGNATTATTAALHGWNLALAIDGKAYPVTRTLGGATLYEETAFASLFTHWQSP